MCDALVLASCRRGEGCRQAGRQAHLLKEKLSRACCISAHCKQHQQASQSADSNREEVLLQGTLCLTP
jgi:hypothetical protein